MSETLPNHEPATLRRGDTVKWLRAVTVYGVQRKPADSWTLTYTFATDNFSTDVTSTTDNGGSFEVTIAATTSDDWPDGHYTWQGRVSKSGEVFTFDEGHLTVLADFTMDDSRGHDGRSFARRALEAIEAVMEGKASRDQQSYNIGDRSISRFTWEELLSARDRFRVEVASEERAQAAKRGDSHAGVIRIGFTRPC